MRNMSMRDDTVARRTQENQQRTENTVVQIKGKDGEWMDYARATEGECSLFLTVSADPSRTWRAVDWLTREEVFEPRP